MTAKELLKALQEADAAGKLDGVDNVEIMVVDSCEDFNFDTVHLTEVRIEEEFFDGDSRNKWMEVHLMGKIL